MTEEKNVKKRNPSWDNIISMADRTEEERKEIGRLGGIKSGESKRRMKTFREELMALLSVEMENNKGEKTTVQKNINSALILKAAKGDVRAYEVIRDTLGQKPVEEKSVVIASPLESRIEIVDEMKKRFYEDDNKKQDN